MMPVLSYLLKTNIVLTALYGFYFLCFRRDTFFVHIRWYMLATIVSAVTFPLVNISAWLAGSPAAMEATHYIPDINMVYQYVLAQSQIILSQPPQVEYAAEPVVVARAIHFGVILLWCWLPVAIFMIGKRLFQLTCIARLWRRYHRQRCANSAIIAVDSSIQPFSFFNRIFLNPALYSQDELDEILVHEQVHCRKRHTIDILLAEALVCFCWFNPAAWLLRRDLKQNLEFYTDRITLRSGFDRKHYQYSMLRVSGNAFQIVNHFNLNNHFYFNHLKKRIIMLNKKESPRIMTAKYLLVIPALAATFLAVQASGLQVNESDDVNVADMNPVLTDVVILLVTGNDDSNMSVEQTVSEKGKPDLSISTQSLGNEIPVIGSSRISSGHPVVVLDGKIIPFEEMTKIDPSTIKSIEILKDKKATDLYGEEAAEGVIIITTKTGTDTDTPPAETIQVTGTVVNAKNGERLPGVSIIVKGSTMGVITDMNGKYSINVPVGANLQFSFAGMDGRDVSVGNNRIIDVVMDTHPEDKLEFRADQFRFRGIGSNNGLEPLWIVDGKEFDKEINTLSSHDILSITVLKELSATSRYGEKGKNGVIIITTKK
jgi:TonB-dependent SusC/RagA subfamily outer membrane receptor